MKEMREKVAVFDFGSQYAQLIRQDTDRIHTCKNCSRFIYMV